MGNALEKLNISVEPSAEVSEALRIFSETMKIYEETLRAMGLADKVKVNSADSSKVQLTISAASTADFKLSK